MLNATAKHGKETGRSFYLELMIVLKSSIEIKEDHAIAQDLFLLYWVLVSTIKTQKTIKNNQKITVKDIIHAERKKRVLLLLSEKSMEYIGIIISVIVVLLIITLLFTGYVKASPDEAAIISGISKKPRVLIGRAGLKIPFFEKVDRMYIGQVTIDINTTDFIPTKDFINIKVDAVAQVSVDTSEERIQSAMRNFLNKKVEDIQRALEKSLQGNLREIIGTMNLKDICQDKAKFSQEVKSNADGDMAELGIKILSFNVQNIIDDQGLISDLGIDNIEQIRKSAQIAKAEAEKEIAIEQAKAENAANEERIKAQTEIARRNNEYEKIKADLKVEEDTKKAAADAAYDIEKQTQRKTIEIKEQEADIARREKEIELQAKEAEVAEKKLIAEVQKPAEAEKYAAVQQADAELYKRQKEAEAQLYEQQKQAEAIRAKGEAEAEAIRAKGNAEAEAMDKKAEAMKKYGNAAILEMIVNVLPDMAKAVAEPISSINDIKIIGSDSSGISEVGGNVPLMLSKVMESVKETTGVDMKEIIKANTYDAKVNRHVTIDGSVPVSTTQEDSQTNISISNSENVTTVDPKK